MNFIDELLANNEAYASEFDQGDLPVSPSKKLAVLACMDSRIDIHGMLGLELGEAHVIRNAGGVVTDDEIRSLAISQHLLGTREIILVHHTDCGMLRFTDDEVADKLEAASGVRPPWSALTFPDLDQSVRGSIAKVKDSPFVPHTDSVRGFVFDVESGKLREVS